MTFENIPGCSAAEETEPPTEPPTEAPTEPPTEAPTEPSVPVIPCTRWATMKVLQDGEAVSFETPNYPIANKASTCMWKMRVCIAY